MVLFEVAQATSKKWTGRCETCRAPSSASIRALPEAFMAMFGHPLHQVPMLAKPLTGDYVRRHLMAMRPTSMNLNGGSLQDLWAPPHWVLQWLAKLMTVVP